MTSDSPSTIQNSHDGFPEVESEDDGNTLVSISTTFFRAAQHRPQQPDVALLSKDAVYFYVHSDLVLYASENRFRAMLPISLSDGHEPPVLNVPETSAVLNIILHAIYDMSCSHYSPTFETLVHAVESMSRYGANPKSTIVPSSPLFTLFLSHAPLFPLELYALAAHYDILELAVPTSSYLLSFPLSRVDDQIVERIGAIYLKRLFFLHFGRAEALKRVLLPPPHLHPPTPSCDFQSQKGLSRAWALASAYLAWDVRPDMSTITLESALRPLAEHLPCELCKSALNERVKNLVVNRCANNMTNTSYSLQRRMTTHLSHIIICSHWF
ncbi:hypothetical protein B0H17DRAFT_1164359 [Mycena rosella]|uniref:BTB domain-containing protein n=1 Tax=Mycena rosella TaxID=1033263 RepID=A0AAD7FLC3_MYCRO|nr:hypothetical protein B0H17DRAFT_1164359 [Mycena rosella]